MYLNQDTGNSLQTQEDKANHLNKVKIKLESTIQEVHNTACIYVYHWLGDSIACNIHRHKMT